MGLKLSHFEMYIRRENPKFNSNFRKIRKQFSQSKTYQIPKDKIIAKETQMELKKHFYEKQKRSLILKTTKKKRERK